ncbi:TIGR04255 family protein [Fodinicurvata halophila]|uniref:TIGR04255 family protein n=1 Tax=Fodinicurvata halophila TaxID=1419723 RepID=UPI003636C7A4
MSTRPGHLPDFTSPPLIEVALGVQFTPLENLQTLHGGIIWEAYKDKYPYTKELPPLPHVLETFGRRQVHSSIPFKLSLQDRPDVPRYWFISENNDQLIQIQKDRFLQNWRKESSKAEYPRYESIREDFFLTIKLFVEHLLTLGLPNLT